MTNSVDLSTSFAGLTLQTPLVLLSGCVGFGEEYTRFMGQFTLLLCKKVKLSR